MMKILVVLSLVIFLAGCQPPTPMNAESKEIAAKCFEAGGIPSYFSNGSKIQLECLNVKR